MSESSSENGTDGRAVYIFPGHGTSKVGIDPANPYIKHRVELAEQILRERHMLNGHGLTDALNSGVDENRIHPKVLQPLIAALSCGALDEIRYRGLEPMPEMVMGHSLGECCAACAAQVISYPDLIVGLAKRGQFMSEANARRGNMLYIRGLDLDTSMYWFFKNMNLETEIGRRRDSIDVKGSTESIKNFRRLIRPLKHRGIEYDMPSGGSRLTIVGMDPRLNFLQFVSNKLDLSVAVVNGDEEIAISGRKTEIRKLARMLNFLKSAKVTSSLLDVPYAAHSSLMEPAMKRMEEFWRQVKFHDSIYPIFLNMGRQTRDGEFIKMSLIKQIVSPVYWSQSIKELLAINIDMEFVEVWPAKRKNLLGLIRNIKKSITRS